MTYKVVSFLAIQLSRLALVFSSRAPSADTITLLLKSVVGPYMMNDYPILHLENILPKLNFPWLSYTGDLGVLADCDRCRESRESKRTDARLSCYVCLLTMHKHLISQNMAELKDKRDLFVCRASHAKF